MPKTSEQWLEEAAPQKRQGIFKLFLGYAPGVGKTYNMLSEGIRRKARGEDVVIGLLETHGRKGVAELAGKMETVPRRQMDYKGASFDEMDVDAILARKPQVVLVDELAHTNIEGSKHPKRYQDVMDLLDANIDVLSTMNVQHIESLMPTVMNITGIQVRETVPDWVMQRVNEIVLADLTPEALRTLAQNLRFAENLGAKVVRSQGKNVAEVVAQIVREKHITQVVFGRSAQSGWTRYFYLSAIHKFLRDAPPVDVHIVAQEMR